MRWITLYVQVHCSLPLHIATLSAMNFVILELSSHSRLAPPDELTQCFESDSYLGALRQSLIIRKLFSVNNTGSIVNVLVPVEMYEDVKRYLDTVGVWDGRRQVFTEDMGHQFAVVMPCDVSVVFDALRARAAVKGISAWHRFANSVVLATVFQVDPHMMMMHNAIHDLCQAYMTESNFSNVQSCDLYAGMFLHSRDPDFT